MADSVFEQDGERFVPTQLARGPWDTNACHGGAPAALVARAVEHLPSAAPMQVVRLTCDLLRPVPIAPLELDVRVTRDGRRVQFAEAEVRADGQPVLRAHALRIRVDDVDVPPSAGEADASMPGPENATPIDVESFGWWPGFATAMEVRFLEGSFMEQGPGRAWLRLGVPLVAGEDPSPLQRVAAASDFGNGISNVLDYDSHLYINPDVTVLLHRLPVGDWIGLDATTVAQPHGVGLTRTALHDRDGRLGTALQTLYVDRR